MLHQRSVSKREDDRDPKYHKRVTDDFIFTSDNYLDDDNYLVLPKNIFENSPGRICFDAL